MVNEQNNRTAARLAIGFGGGGLLFALGGFWLLYPDWFVARLQVPYPLQVVLNHYRNCLQLLPNLFLVAAFALMFFGLTVWTTRKSTSPTKPLPLLSPITTFALLTCLWLAGIWLSWRHWNYFGRPNWDDYWRAGEVWHLLLRDHSLLPQVIQFIHQYPHSPSPLTPWLIALLMFALPKSLLWLQLLNTAATAASVAVLQRISKRTAPDVPFWLIGALFLTNAATMRNAFFIQLDAINGFFVLAFFLLWLRWREQSSLARLIVLSFWTTLAVLQKTTLFPLMAVPAFVELIQAVRLRKLDFGRLVSLSLWTAIVPATAFASYCLAFGIFSNFGTQVELMGTGWNELDFSLSRFLFATGFLLGPYLPLLLRNKKLFVPENLGPLLYVLLFFFSIVVVKGPFWGRYYSHIVGCWLLLALPALTASLEEDSRPVLLTWFFGAIAVQTTMIWLQLF